MDSLEKNKWEAVFAYADKEPTSNDLSGHKKRMRDFMESYDVYLDDIDSMKETFLAVFPDRESLIKGLKTAKDAELLAEKNYELLMDVLPLEDWYVMPNVSKSMGQQFNTAVVRIKQGLKVEPFLGETDQLEASYEKWAKQVSEIKYVHTDEQSGRMTSEVMQAKDIMALKGAVIEALTQGAVTEAVQSTRGPISKGRLALAIGAGTVSFIASSLLLLSIFPPVFLQPFIADLASVMSMPAMILSLTGLMGCALVIMFGAVFWNAGPAPSKDVNVPSPRSNALSRRLNDPSEAMASLATPRTTERANNHGVSEEESAKP